MSNQPNNNRKVQYERAADEWYVEPRWAADLIFSEGLIPADLPVFDPACGKGTIVDAARMHGHRAGGSDIVDRGGTDGDLIDFFKGLPVEVETMRAAGKPVAIVSNPPFNLAIEWAIRALDLNMGPVALIFQLRWLAGLTRAALYREYEPCIEAVYSDRPSMPPGASIYDMGDAAFSGGTIDFAVVVWNAERTGPTISRKLYRREKIISGENRLKAAKRRVAEMAKADD